MTLNEILQQLFGATDEQLASLAERMKENKIFTAGEENLDIRYGKLKTENEGVVQELATTKKTLEDLRTATAGQEELQQRLADHDKVVAQLQQQLADEKWRNRARIGLMQAGADDIDYVMYKLEEGMAKEGKQRVLNEAEEIEGWSDLLKTVQTQIPQRFPKSDDEDGYEVFNPNKLKNGDGGEPTVTRERFRQMGYEERLALKTKNEKLFRELSK